MTYKYGIAVHIKESLAQTPVQIGTELVFIGIGYATAGDNTLKKFTSMDDWKGDKTSSVGLSLDYAFNICHLDHAWAIPLTAANAEALTAEQYRAAYAQLDDLWNKNGIIPSLIVITDGHDITESIYNTIVSELTAKAVKLNDLFKAQVVVDVNASGNKPDNTPGNLLVTFGTITSGSNTYPMSSVVACLRAEQDSKNTNGLPYRSVGNLYIKGASDYSNPMAKSQADEKASNGIICAINKGLNRWYTWGDHTAAVTAGSVEDELYRFDSNVAIFYHLANRFILKWQNSIDAPMTLALRNDIINEEQNYLDSLVSIGALVGDPKAEFKENTVETLALGQFYFTNIATPTVPAKYIEMNLQYTVDGISAYLGE